MSTVTNRDPYVHQEPEADPFQFQNGFTRQPLPVPAPEPAGFGRISFWVEYFSADRLSGRFLAGPFQDRRRAVRRATEMLAETTDGKRVEGVTIKAYRA